MNGTLYTFCKFESEMGGRTRGNGFWGRRGNQRPCSCGPGALTRRCGRPGRAGDAFSQTMAGGGRRAARWRVRAALSEPPHLGCYKYYHAAGKGAPRCILPLPPGAPVCDRLITARSLCAGSFVSNRSAGLDLQSRFPSRGTGAPFRGQCRDASGRHRIIHFRWPLVRG